MEADVYESICTSIGANQTFVLLPFSFPFRMKKIVWATWDYIMGPEFRFVWEVCQEDNTIQLRRDTEDLLSNLTIEQKPPKPVFPSATNTAASGIVVAEVHVCGKCCRLNCDGLSCLPNGAGNSSFDDLPTDGLSTPVLSALSPLSTQSTSTQASSNFPLELQLNFRESTSSDQIGSDDSDGDSNTLVPSMQSSVHEQQQPIQVSVHSQSEPVFPVFELEKKTSLDSNCSSIGFISEPEQDTEITFDAQRTRDRPTTLFDERNSSNSATLHQQSSSSSISVLTEDDDQGLSIRPSISTSAPLDESTASSSVGVSNEQVPDSEDQAASAQIGDCREELSDEAYIALHSLSSELCRNRIGRTVDFKLLSVPSRQLLIACYIFSAKHKDTEAVQSFSLVMGEQDSEWFLQYQQLLKRYLIDTIQRTKASFYVDNFEETIARLSTHWKECITLIHSLESFGLGKIPFKIADTFLATNKLVNNQFLRQCISAVLQTQGHVAVAGADVKKVNRMVQTLGFFLLPEERHLCRYYVTTRQMAFSHYLRVQGLYKDQVDSVTQKFAFSDWPIALVDLDQQKVIFSPWFPDHSTLQHNAVLHDLRQLLNTDSVDSTYSTSLSSTNRFQKQKLDESFVARLFIQMDQLPYDCSIREAFLRQFLRMLGHKALSFIAFVKNMPPGTPLNLNKIRKSQDLSLDSDFRTVLSFAERCVPAFVNLLYPPSPGNMTRSD